MKKILLIFSLGLISFGLFAQTTQSSKMANSDASRWSLGVKGGMDFYRVNPYGNHIGWDASLNLEYSITPLFGMGLEAGYFNYDRSQDNVGDYDGSTIDILIYGSLNISNLVSPMRSGFWRNVNLYSTAGYEVGFYNYDVDYKTPGYGADRDDSGNITGAAAFGMELAFNLGQAWELGLGGQYRYYTKNNLGGQPNSTFGSDALSVTLGFRYKFGANKGNHVRNMTPAEYFPMANVTNINVDAQTIRHLKVLEDENLRNKVAQLENDLRALENKNTDVVNASFHNVEFDFNSSNLTAEGKQALDQIARVLKNNTAWNKLKITGHTDNIGTREVNQTISEQRATTVKNYLVAQGIPASKMETLGRGENIPASTNRTEEGRQLNRRVEFEITR